MDTVFIGGSRHVTRLPALAKERLQNIVSKGLQVIVGDAAGADKAVQKFLFDASYSNVTVFCSGEKPRNNVGLWPVRTVIPTGKATGFQFYAAKDRAMAKEADFGLMIWDGKSPGTVLNILRLVRNGKMAVLLAGPNGTTHNFKTDAEWQDFLRGCSQELLSDLRERALPEEWSSKAPHQQANLFEATPPESDPAPLDALNKALAAGDIALFGDALGTLAKARGMTQVAKDAGMARESLYRSFDKDGNPEFATVLKVMAAVGLQLTANQAGR